MIKINIIGRQIKTPTYREQGIGGTLRKIAAVSGNALYDVKYVEGQQLIILS